MSIDPAYFDSAADALGVSRWPDKGETIWYRCKSDDEWSRGQVRLVWCGIDIAVEIVNGPTLYVALGDEIERPEAGPS